METKFIILAVILMGVSFYGGYYLNDNTTEIDQLSKENYLLHTLFIAESNMQEASLKRMAASKHYEQASLSYERENYIDVEKECKLAREDYLIASQKYRDTGVVLKASNIDHNLVTKYIQLIDTSIEISNNMFEACEHFESAARYYEIYYNGDVPEEDLSFNMGGKEIDMMNEKINAHDNAVGRHNNILAEYKFELNKEFY